LSSVLPISVSLQFSQSKHPTSAATRALASNCVPLALALMLSLVYDAKMQFIAFKEKMEIMKTVESIWLIHPSLNLLPQQIEVPTFLSKNMIAEKVLLTRLAKVVMAPPVMSFVSVLHY